MRDGDRELAILGCGLEDAEIGILQQRETAGEAAVEALNAMEALVLLLLFLLAFSLIREQAIIHHDLDHVLG